MLSLQNLNFDVLSHIIKYLPDLDRLKLASLQCKRINEVLRNVNPNNIQNCTLNHNLLKTICPMSTLSYRHSVWLERLNNSQLNTFFPVWLNFLPKPGVYKTKKSHFLFEVTVCPYQLIVEVEVRYKSSIWFQMPRYKFDNSYFYFRSQCEIEHNLNNLLNIFKLLKENFNLCNAKKIHGNYEESLIVEYNPEKHVFNCKIFKDKLCIQATTYSRWTIPL